MPAGCFSGGVGRVNIYASQMSDIGDDENQQEISAIKWPWSGCFNFSCEGSALLDDENVPCLEHCPEAEIDEDRVYDNRRMSDITLAGSVSNEEVGVIGILSCIRPAGVITTQSEVSSVPEKDSLLTAKKKLPNKSYNSFEPSPPLEGIMNSNQAVTSSVELTDSCEALKPLVCKSSQVCEESERITNDLDFVIKKEISYNKVLPFPIMKSFSSYDYSGAVNSLVEFDSDTKSHSVSLGCGQNTKLSGSNSFASSTALTRETMILCNDLDSACQVVPLSFSPNLYPDVGSVPFINCQVSVNNTVPPETFNSCKSNSLVTLTNQTKCPNNQPASWPRRRPQSLRVALCYSDPECLQDVDCLSLSSARQQEIGLSDISASYKEVFPSPYTTSLLTVDPSADIEAINKKQDICCVDPCTNISKCGEDDLGKTLEEMKPDEEENLNVVKDAKPYGVHVDEILGVCDDIKMKNLDILGELAPESIDVNKKFAVCVDGNQCPSDLHDKILMSPSSDKESDPSLVSVRPKVQSFNTVHSPKKKISPKLKHRSPKKFKLASMREALPRQQKSLPVTACEKENPRSEESRFRSLDDDVWAVDDFLPVVSRSQSRSLPQVLQDFKVSPTKATGVLALASVVEVPISVKAQANKPVSTPLSFDEMDSSMITSTFSTDTGYETETTVSVNSACNDDCSTNGEKLSTSITSPQSDIQKDPLTEKCNSTCNSLPSNFTTPAVSELATPQTVADDTTEYYSICSELTNLIHALNDTPLPKNPGDDTPDYLSISSEILGISRLPEDSPSADLEMQQLIPENVVEAVALEECHEKPESLSNLGSSPMDSVASGDPSTLVETPACQDAGSGEQSLSDDSLLSHNDTPSQELVEIKYVQLSLSIVLAIVLHAMQSISQFMLEIFLSSDQEERWD